LSSGCPAVAGNRYKDRKIEYTGLRKAQEWTDLSDDLENDDGNNNNTLKMINN